MATLDSSAAAYLFKLLAEKKLDDKALKRGNPLTEWMEQVKDFSSSRGYEVASEYSNPQGAGATFQIAAATSVPSKGVVFSVPQRKYVMQASLAFDVIQNAESGDGDAYFADAVSRQVDGVTNQFGKHIERQAWGTNVGVRGVVLTGTSSASFTLVDKTSAQILEVGQGLDFYTSAGVLRTTGGAAAVVTSINRSTGAITTTGGPTTIAPTDVIVGRGDGANFAVPPAQFAIDGIQGWNPEVPSASFLGVDQTIDRERVAGVFVDGSADNVRNAFIKGHQVASLMGGDSIVASAPIFLNPLNYASLEMSVEASKIIYLDGMKKYGIGIEGFSIGSMNFVQAGFCPVNRAFKIGQGAFKRYTSGEMPALWAPKGSDAFTMNQGTGDVTFSLFHLGNCASPKPYQLMHIKLNPQTVL